jgi:O-acetyl-ADP-ribose deacetylase (regulator of RNase III)
MGSVIGRIVRELSTGSVRSDLQRHAPVESGTVVTTEGYNIAEYIIHAITAPDQHSQAETIRMATQATLKEADELGCEAISMPVLGTGAGDLPFEQRVKITGKALDSYYPDTLSSINLICRAEADYERVKHLRSQTGTPWVDRSLPSTQD